MEKLRKRGKNKLRFRIMNPRVSNRDLKYIKELTIESLRENPVFAEQLAKMYRRIQFFIYFESSNPDLENTLREYLHDPNISGGSGATPAFVLSRNRLGCVCIFIKHLNEFTERRSDVNNIRNYHKNGVFEELCHLIEQDGDNSTLPDSYYKLTELYFKTTGKNKMGLVMKILGRLDTNRNHYEVYNMMIQVYPNEWVERYYLYFSNTPEWYENKYAEDKKTRNIKVALAIYATDYLQHLATLLIAKKVSLENLSKENNDKLRLLIAKGKADIEHRNIILERDSPILYQKLIKINEKVFTSSTLFFDFVLNLWSEAQII